MTRRTEHPEAGVAQPEGAPADRPRSAAGVLAAGAAIAGVALAGAYALSRRRGGDAVDERAGYPPLDTPKPIAPDLWVADSRPLHTAGLVLPIRMTVMRLAGGDLLLHSPTRLTTDVVRAVEALGRVRHLVAPNSAHWTFTEAWQRAYPGAIVWGAPGLRERPQVQRSGLRIDRDLAAAAPEAWAGAIGQGVVAAGGFREVYLFHKASRTLVLTDLVQNMEPAKLPPATRLFARLSAGADGTTPRYLRAVLRLGGAPVREQVGAMLALAPERVVFAHGRWFAEDGAARLARAFSWLVPQGRWGGR